MKALPQIDLSRIRDHAAAKDRGFEVFAYLTGRVQHEIERALGANGAVLGGIPAHKWPRGTYSTGPVSRAPLSDIQRILGAERLLGDTDDEPQPDGERRMIDLGRWAFRKAPVSCPGVFGSHRTAGWRVSRRCPRGQGTVANRWGPGARHR